MFKHIDARKPKEGKDKKDAWRQFMIETGFGPEFEKYEIPLEGKKNGKARVLRVFSWGHYQNTVGLITAYCSWSEGPGGETWQLNWHWSLETERPVGKPVWLKVRG